MQWLKTTVILLTLFVSSFFYSSRVVAQTTQPASSQLSQTQIEDIKELSIRINNFKNQAKTINLQLAAINKILSERYNDSQSEGIVNPQVSTISAISKSLAETQIKIDNLKLTLVLESGSATKDINKAITDLKKKTAEIKSTLIKIKIDEKSLIDELEK